MLLINPPIAIAAASSPTRVVDRPPHARPSASFDLAGALTLTIGQMVLVYGVVEGGPDGLGLVRGARPDRRRRRCCSSLFGVIETRFASAPLIPFKELTQAAARRQQDRAAVQRRAVPDVVPQLALPAAGARPLAASHRADLPADGADDRGRRLARRASSSSRFGVRAGARRRADDDDRRDAAASRGSARAAARSSTS